MRRSGRARWRSSRSSGSCSSGAGRRTATGADADAWFERKLYVIRKRVEHAVDAMGLADRNAFYVPSLSSRTLIYKGMLKADQIAPMFPDLADPDVESALALVHQRFSTNTFPSWPLAHPYRFVAHNGEINTLRGNINWMQAREALLESDVLGDDLKKILPIIREGGSDTATFDNVLEFLVMAGRSLPHAVLMMIPEPWQNHEGMSPELRAFYEYHSSLMEPWDGPASIAFTDGTRDRRRARPQRAPAVALLRHDRRPGDHGVGGGRPRHSRRRRSSSRSGCTPGASCSSTRRRGGSSPTRRSSASWRRPSRTREWLRQNMTQIEDLPAAPYLPPPSHETVLRRQHAFGYTQEDLRIVLGPMASAGEEPIGSMGTDTPLAVLSERPRLLYDYFTQLFAQVTNPPLDAIREELVTSMESTIGPEGNLLKPGPESCRQIGVTYPIIDNDQLAKLRHIDAAGVSIGHAADALPAGGRGARPRVRARGAPGAGEPGGQGRRDDPDPVGSRRHARVRADPEPAGDGRRPPSSRARGHPHPVRARHRIGRRARSAPRRAAHRLRRRRGQPVPGVRDARRHDPPAGPRRHPARARRHELHQGAQQGHPQGDVEDGDLDAAELLRRADLRSGRPRPGVRRPALHVDRLADRRRRPRGRRPGSPPAARARVPGPPRRSAGSRQRRRVPVAARRRDAPVQPADRAEAPARDALGPVRHLSRVHGARERSEPDARHAARPARFRAGRAAGSDRGGRAGRGDREAVRDRRDVVRIDQPGSARDDCHRDEPAGREVEHRRRGRGPRPLRARCERRFAAQRHQAGRVGAVRRDQRVPRQRRRSADQDGAGREAGRGRPAPGAEGLPVDRQSAPLDARRHAALAAAAPRHLFHRGSGAADLRSEKRQPGRAGAREARRRGRRGHDCGRRRQGPRRRRADLRPRRRHRRVAAHGAQAQRHSVGARARRDAAGAPPQRPPRSDRRAGGRAAQDRPRRRDCGAARRRRVRLRDRRPGGVRLHHDARLPPEYVPGRRRDAGPRAAQEVQREAGVRRELLPLRGRGRARADGGARVPHGRRDGGPRRPSERQAGPGSLESRGCRPVADSLPARRCRRRRPGGGPRRRTTGCPRCSITRSSPPPRRRSNAGSR